MLFSLKHLRGMGIHATDGDMGAVDDVLFDDQFWIIRYIVVDTRKWLPGRKVLITPEAADAPDFDNNVLVIRHTRNEIRTSPDIETSKPVSRQQEQAIFEHFRWVPYWTPNMVDFRPYPLPIPEPMDEEQPEEDAPDKHLRSAKEVVGYTVEALDGRIGHVEDFLVRSSDWRIRMVAIDTRNWLPGGRVAIAADWIRGIVYSEQRVYIDLQKETIKDSPALESDEPVHEEFEDTVVSHYGESALRR